MIQVIHEELALDDGLTGLIHLCGMHIGHTPVSRWGISHVQPAPNARILDILRRHQHLQLLQAQPQGKIRDLATRCAAWSGLTWARLHGLDRGTLRGGAGRCRQPPGPMQLTWSLPSRPPPSGDVPAAFIPVCRMLETGPGLQIHLRPRGHMEADIDGMVVSTHTTCAAS